MTINGIEVNSFITHPRVLEIRFILFYSNLKASYDYDTAINLIKALCGVFRVNYNFLSTIVANEYNIMRLSKTDRKAWYRDVVFSGHLYGETRWIMSRKYLGIHKKTLYRADYDLAVTSYVNQNWLDSLNDRAVVCGVPHMRMEVLRFMEGVEHFLEVMGNVAIAKT